VVGTILESACEILGGFFRPLKRICRVYRLRLKIVLETIRYSFTIFFVILNPFSRPLKRICCKLSAHQKIVPCSNWFRENYNGLRSQFYSCDSISRERGWECLFKWLYYFF